MRKMAKFGFLEVCFGVVSEMEVLWDDQNTEKRLMALQLVGSYDTQQAKPDQDIWLCS